jgi:hypothetical protein
MPHHTHTTHHTPVIQDPGSRNEIELHPNKKETETRRCPKYQKMGLDEIPSSKIGDDQGKVQSVPLVPRIFRRISHSWPGNGEENFEILSN